MAISRARENILKRIRQALSNPVPLPFLEADNEDPVFSPAAEPLELLFAKEFTGLQGKFAFCIDAADLEHQVKGLISAREWTKIFCREDQWAAIFGNSSDLSECDAAVTTCELLVARTGSIVLSAQQQSGRTVSVYAPVHICIAYTNQLVYEVKDALTTLRERYGDRMPSLITFASGPSRTADIEKTLVTGVHGPKEVFLFLVDREA